VKRLSLFRHAQARSQFGVADIDRPLTQRGIEEAAAMARRMAEEGLQPDLILASTARRTLETAEILAAELALPAARIQADRGLYLAEPEALLERIRITAGDVKHLMLVGHNPGLSDFARQLAPERRLADLATAGLCSATLEAPSWEQLRPGKVAELLRDEPGRFFKH
jgi:phosphohistidine phosphatase